jgi:predicted RNA polymerase sigma factor
LIEVAAAARWPNNAFGEKPVLKLMFGAMIRAAEHWRAIRITDFEHRQMAALRRELDQEYETRNGLDSFSSLMSHHGQARAPLQEVSGV